MPRIRTCVALSIALSLAACTSPSSDRAAPSPSPTSGATTTSSAPAPTGATASSSAPAPTGATATSPPSSGSPSPVPTTFALAAPEHATFLVHGAYPRERSRCVDHHRSTITARYPGSVTVSRADDGTYSVTVSLPFESYLDGIAEMPASWPMAALEAQAIAARSYALASTGWTGQGETLPEPICSTSSCQVYRGVPLEPYPDLARWERAVRRTRGEILVYDDRPAETFYFSTSNGHTYGNEDVFGGSPLPYLRPVTETDDGASPTSHWTATIAYRDLSRFLAAAGDRPAGAITGVRLDGSRVVIDGEGGPTTLDLSTFRDDVNAWAPCLEPARYPEGGLPTTIPSIWLSLASGRRSVTVTGRGWGHGVGMVQWGAYGKARRGWSADRILSFYYGGFEPQRYPEPGVIQVQVASGLESLSVVASRAGVTVNGEPTGGRRISFGVGQLVTGV